MAADGEHSLSRHKNMTRPAAAMPPMTHPFFSMCSAAPVDAVLDEVETPDEPADCVLVILLVAVRMPVAVVTALLVD